MAITLNDFKEGGKLRQFVTKVGLLDKIDSSDVDQNDLLAKLRDSISHTVVAEDAEKNNWEYDEELDNTEVFEDDEINPNVEVPEDNKEEEKEDDDLPEVDDDPKEVETLTKKWDYIKDESTWNAAYEKEPLQKYYEDHPEEDLWNTTENRAVNFNDRWYTGTIDGEEVSCGTSWAADGVQKITVDGTDYFFEIWGYDLTPKDCELFSNVEMTESTGKTFEIATVSFSENCVHCWQGAINAPGASYPWAVIDVPAEFHGTIKCEYKETVKYPWGEEYKDFNKGYAIFSIPTEFGEEFKVDENGNAKTTFAKTKLNIYLVTEE